MRLHVPGTLAIWTLFLGAALPALALDGAQVQRLLAEGQAAEARTQALAAAQAGEWRAAHFMAWAAEDGVGGAPDHALALKMAAQAAASGDWIARYDHARLLAGDAARAEFTKLAGEGYSPAMLRLADDPSLDVMARANWVDKAAKLGHPTAWAMQAAAMPPAQAAALYRKALLAGHLRSALALSELPDVDRVEAGASLFLALAQVNAGARYYGEPLEREEIDARLERVLPGLTPDQLTPRIQALQGAYALAPWPCNIECQPWRSEIW